MKNSRRMLVGLVFTTLALFCAAGTALAQDPAKVAPNNYKVLLENDRVRVLEFQSKPGDKIGMHSHPDCVLYSFSGGKTKFTYPDGKTTEREGQAGQAIWRNAETHATENVGTGELHILLVELKGSAKKGSAKKETTKKPY
jgi:quercetin dioxygenase-like cupin family protein